MMQFIEKPFFFNNEGSKLFGILHTPCAEVCSRKFKKPRGIVFCSPFAEELTIAHRVVTDFARVVCQKGYFVLRFDYRGCGDSEDEFEQATLTTRLSDISAAVDVLYQKMDRSGHIILFGLRLGGTLAALVAAADSRVKSLILWEPIIEVPAYFDQFLRMQVVAENRREGKTIKTRKSLHKDLQEGKCVDILGFILSPTCYKEFINVDFLAKAGNFVRSTLIVAISKRIRERRDLQVLMQTYKEHNTLAQMLHVQEQPFWIDPDDPYRELASWHNHEALFQKTFEWLDSIDR